ncbi:MAG: hypothetical protein ABJA60_03325, partial [Nitrosospira sp.]
VLQPYSSAIFINHFYKSGFQHDAAFITNIRLPIIMLDENFPHSLNRQVNLATFVSLGFAMRSKNS